MVMVTLGGPVYMPSLVASTSMTPIADYKCCILTTRLTPVVEHSFVQSVADGRQG